jgi:glycosyltransferase 2 family protein
MRAEAQDARSAPRAGTERAPGGVAPRPWWPTLKRALVGALFLALAVLLWRHAYEVDWHAVADVVRGYAASTLLLAAGLAAASHALYACYDLIGRRHVGHRLPTTQVLATAFVSYAFNLNLGALVGGVALRFRLYSRMGLPAGTIAQVLGLSIATNWLGYLVIAGSVFVAFPLALPPGWPLSSGSLRGLGLLLLALAFAYLLMCSIGRRRVWRLRGHEFTLPSAPVALLQLALSCANWLLIAGVVAVLLGGRLDYASVLGVLLIAAVAGVVAHVPAGLGVLEAVFIALLAHRVAQAELIGALLAYRAVYYLAPLALALGVYLALEARTKRAAHPPQAR